MKKLKAKKVLIKLMAENRVRARAKRNLKTMKKVRATPTTKAMTKMLRMIQWAIMKTLKIRKKG